MTELIFRTKMQEENSTQEDLRNKPRIYFSCHPDDFSGSFDRICNDIFKTHNCTVFYKKDMYDSLPSGTSDTDLGRINLFVAAVTTKLLREDPGAVDGWLVYALRNNKPVIPIVVEELTDPDLFCRFNDLYNSSALFGGRQYLNIRSTDESERSYREKLKIRLDETLLDVGMIERIRGEFNAYIFLSYRKKDRTSANELMRFIHSLPECRDIAIWFDEFLTPGEDFNTSIKSAMKKSGLFILLVTPNLLEEGNFVMEKEYPTALGYKDQGRMEILPIEKHKYQLNDPVSRKELSKHYDALPEIVNAADENSLKAAVLDAVKYVRKKDVSQSDKYMHEYLIGLAYLDGIDVETNVDYGIELITDAARHSQLEAMQKLGNMYLYGNYVNMDEKKANHWLKETYFSLSDHAGDHDEKTLRVLLNVAKSYTMIGYDNLALELFRECFNKRREMYGFDNPDTLEAMYLYANELVHTGENERALNMFKLCCNIMLDSKYFDEAYKLKTMIRLAECYAISGDHENALSIGEECLREMTGILGESDPDTLDIVYFLSREYDIIGNTERGNELRKKYFTIVRAANDDSDDIRILMNLETKYNNETELEKLYEVRSKIANLYCRRYGKQHDSTQKYVRLAEETKFWLGVKNGSGKITFKDVEQLSERYSKAGRHRESLDIMLNNIANGYNDHPRIAAEYLRTEGCDAKKVFDFIEEKFRDSFTGTDGRDNYYKFIGNLAEVIATDSPMLSKYEIRNLTSLFYKRYEADLLSIKIGSFMNEPSVRRRIDKLHDRIMMSYYEECMAKYPVRSSGWITEAKAVIPIYERNKELGKALEYSEKLLGACSGENGVELVSVLSDIARIYWKMKRYNEAFEYYEKCYETFSKLGEPKKRPDNLTAVCFDISDKRSLAGQVEFAERLYELRCRYFGEDDDDVIELFGAIGVVYGDRDMPGNPYQNLMKSIEQLEKYQKKILEKDMLHDRKKYSMFISLADAYKEAASRTIKSKQCKEYYDKAAKVYNTIILICKTEPYKNDDNEEYYTKLLSVCRSKMEDLTKQRTNQVRTKKITIIDLLLFIPYIVLFVIFLPVRGIAALVKWLKEKKKKKADKNAAGQGADKTKTD